MSDTKITSFWRPRESREPRVTIFVSRMSNVHLLLIPRSRNPHKKIRTSRVLINEEVLRGMNLEEPTILIGITGIFMSTSPISIP